MSTAILFPVIMVAIPFIFVIFVLWIRSRETNQRNRMRMEIYTKALEKGEKLPENLFEESSQKKNKSLKTGILLVFTGFGISLFMLLVNPEYVLRAIGMGMVPLFLGIGFLVVHIVYRKLGMPDEE